MPKLTLRLRLLMLVFLGICQAPAKAATPPCPMVTTFYGPLEVCEPVVHELIASPVMQRLKGVMQYGLATEVCQSSAYNRYDHSLGVFYLLRQAGRSLPEQLAGLLHDASHTVFSHTGDVFHQHLDGESSYQDSIHLEFLERHGIGAILQRYGFSLASVDHKQAAYRALEQSLPELCADRLDYNIQGAFHSHVLTHEEARAAVADLRFADGHWSFSDKAMARKIAQYSIHMSKHCWSSVETHLISTFLSVAMRRAIELGELKSDDVSFGVDADVWASLQASGDAQVRQSLQRLAEALAAYRFGEAKAEALAIPTKFRGIDPWLRAGGDAPARRLTQLDARFRGEFLREQEVFKRPLFVSF